MTTAHGAAEAVDSVCRNCGTHVGAARFCGACGQSTTLHPLTVREFFHEFITHNVALEGALWRTLKALLLHPGSLTVEYLAGRRARYIAPLRLYLSFSLILFAFGMSGGELRLGSEKIQFKVPEDVRSGQRRPDRTAFVAQTGPASARSIARPQRIMTSSRRRSAGRASTSGDAPVPALTC